MKPTYFEKLKDPRWQKKRLECLEAADWACHRCRDSESPLHVHHKQYLKGRQPWEYEVGQLEVLCEGCHKLEHETEDELQLAASFAPGNGPLDRQDFSYILLGMIGKPLDSEALTCPWAMDRHFIGAVAYELADMTWMFEFDEKARSIDPYMAAKVMFQALASHYGIATRSMPVCSSAEDEV